MARDSPKADRYRKEANRTKAEAAEASNADAKGYLLDIASKYERLAELAEQDANDALAERAGESH